VGGLGYSYRHRTRGHPQPLERTIDTGVVVPIPQAVNRLEGLVGVLQCVRSDFGGLRYNIGMRQPIDGDQHIDRYIWAIFRYWGWDRSMCQLCGHRGITELHHTKYDGCTLYDIRIVCRSCNRLSVNCGLA